MLDYQWKIFWANLDPTKDSEQSGIRPVIIISVEESNLFLPIKYYIDRLTERAN